MNIKSYPYAPKIWVGPLSFVLFGGLGYYLYNSEQRHEDFNYKGLHFEGATADWIHLTFSGLLALLSLMSLNTTYQRFFGEKKTVDITATDITTPKALFADRATIKFSDIIYLGEQCHRSNRTLVAMTRVDKCVISSLNLSKKDYEEIRGILIAKRSNPQNLL